MPYLGHMSSETVFTIPPWSVPDRLRKAREHAGLEQGELAESIDVSRTTVSNYERGHVNPRKIVVRQWALRTGVPFEWLMYGTEDPRPVDPDGGVRLPRLDSNQQPSGYSTPQVITGPWTTRKDVAA